MFNPYINQVETSVVPHFKHVLNFYEAWGGGTT